MQTLILLYILYELSEMKRRQEHRLIQTLHYRQLRDLSDPFAQPEGSFKRNFAMPQALALELLSELEPWDTKMYSRIPFHIKVLSTLHFYAKGSYQIGVARNNDVNVGQSTVSRAIHYISTLIDDHLSNKYIRFPITPEEKNAVKRRFVEEFNMPNVIGAIDCTHITIIRPSLDDERRPPRLYFSRKKVYSLNVEATVDADMIFRSVNPKFPGATHDSGVWMKSPVRRHLKDQYIRHHAEDILLGDKGYPLEPYLFTPYSNPQNNLESRYNTLHGKARVTIERSFGVLKATFRCLLKHRVLHYRPVIAGKIVNSCVTIYNFMKRRGVSFENVQPIIEDVDYDGTPDEGYLYTVALRKRNEYITTL